MQVVLQILMRSAVSICVFYAFLIYLFYTRQLSVTTGGLPTQVVLKKPILKVEGTSKIPVNVRQAYLERFFDVCVKIYPDDADARQRVGIMVPPVVDFVSLTCKQVQYNTVECLSDLSSTVSFVISVTVSWKKLLVYCHSTIVLCHFTVGRRTDHIYTMIY